MSWAAANILNKVFGAVFQSDYCLALIVLLYSEFELVHRAVCYAFFLAHVGDWLSLELEESVVDLTNETPVSHYKDVSIIFVCACNRFF